MEDSPVTRASGSEYIVITATFPWEGSGKDVPFSSLGSGRDRTLGVPVFGAMSYIRSSNALGLAASSPVSVGGSWRAAYLFKRGGGRSVIVLIEDRVKCSSIGAFFDVCILLRGAVNKVQC